MRDPSTEPVGNWARQISQAFDQRILTMLAEIFLLQIENKIRIAAPARDQRFVPIVLAAPVRRPERAA
jgi:hypothetical protein